MKKLLGTIVLAFGLFVLGACDPTEEAEINVTSDLAEAELSVEPDTALEIGEEATITASTVEGYEFVHWEEEGTGDVVSTDLSYTFPVATDLTLVAVYDEIEDEVDTYEITLQSDHGDAELSVTPEGEIEEGEDVTIFASQIEGYVFDHWLNTETEEIFSEEAEYTFAIDADMTLEAVYLDEYSAAADETIEDFEGDLSHLEELEANFEASDAHTIEWMFLIEEEDFDDPEIIHTYQVEWMQRVVEEGDTLTTETQMTFTMPGEDPIDFHMIVEETEHYYEVYADVGFFVDELEEEMEMDVRELLDFEGDYAYMFLPIDESENFVEEFVAIFLAELEEEGVDPEGLEAALAEFERFEKYMTLEYYNEHEHLEVEAEKINDTEVMTTIIVNPEMMQDLFEDVFKDVYHVLLPLDGEDELPPYDDFVETDEYEQMLADIENMDPFDISLVHEPFTSDSIRMERDLLALLEALDEDFTAPGVETMEFSMEISSHAEIEPLPETNDIILIAEELLQFGIMFESLEYAMDIYHDDAIEAGTYTLADLAEEGHVYEIPLMDPELSEVVVHDDERDVVLDFVFANNEEPVFTEPLDFATLTGVFEDEPETREDFLAIIDHVDESNIAMYLILGELIELVLEEMQEPDYEPLPEEDLMGEDFEGLTRYPGSIIYHYEETEEYTDIYYAAETTLEDAYAYFEDYVDDEAWTIHHEEVEFAEGYFVIVLAHEDYENLGITIIANEESPYQDAISIIVEVELQEPDEATLPEEDVDEGEDLENVDRYPESVIIDYHEGDDSIDVVYGAPTTLSDAYDFYETFFDDEEWKFVYEDVNIEEGDFLMIHERDGDEYIVYGDADSPFEDAIILVVSVEYGD